MLTVATPRTAIITGSGIAESFAPYPVLQRIPFTDISGMETSHVPGHPGELRVVDIDGTHVLVFLGRQHLYEGLQTDNVCVAIRLCAELGIQRVLLTNASGGLHPLLSIGDVVMCTDVMNFTMKRVVQRETTMRIIDQQWTSQITSLTRERGIGVKHGTYIQVLGPSYETRAEIRMLRVMGADVVGMSTVLEAGKAAELGLSVAIASVVTNVLSDTTPHVLSHNDVLIAGRSSVQSMQTIIHSAIFAP